MGGAYGDESYEWVGSELELGARPAAEMQKRYDYVTRRVASP